MPTQNNANIANSLYEAYNDRDFERGAVLLAENFELLNVPLGVTLRGVDGYRQFVEGWATAFPDSKVEVSQVIASEEGAVIEFRGHGTHTGPLASPAGTIPPTGKQVEVPFCDVMKIKDGKITSLHSYYDSATLMGQLGLLS